MTALSTPGPVPDLTPSGWTAMRRMLVELCRDQRTDSQPRVPLDAPQGPRT